MEVYVGGGVEEWEEEIWFSHEVGELKAVGSVGKF